MSNDKQRQLTPREKQVIALLADGYTNAEVGQILGISQRTAEVHHQKITIRLQIHDMAGLVKYALQQNLTTLEKHRDDPRLPN